MKSALTITWLSTKELCFQPTFHTEEDFAPISEIGDVLVMAVSHNSAGMPEGVVRDSFKF